jgi:hypothetical protein
MKLYPCLVFISILVASCKFSESKPAQTTTISCPETIGSTSKFPSTWIFSGPQPDSTLELIGTGIIDSSGTDFLKQIWSEDILDDWNETSYGTELVANYDSTQSDHMLKCSYQGVRFPHGNKDGDYYHGRHLLIPLPSKQHLTCVFKISKSSKRSGQCEVIPYPKPPIFSTMNKFGKPWLDPNLPPLPPLDESELRQIRIYQSMTPYQRWMQAAALREMAGRLRRAALKRDHPEWTDAELDKAVLEFFLNANT